MPVNEALGILAQIVICIEGSLQDLKGDVLGHVPGPAFRRVEGDDAEVVLAAHPVHFGLKYLKSGGA